MAKRKKRTATREKADENVPLPAGFIAEMKSMLGPEQGALLARSLDEAPSVSIRFNRRKVGSQREILSHFDLTQTEGVPWCSSGIYLPSRPDFIHDPLMHAGAYYVQEAASMVYESLIEDLAREFPADMSLAVLDLCAAPGGKTTAMLNGLIGRRYAVVANEYDRKRVTALKENLDKWGDPNVIVTNSSSADIAKLEDRFDIVAVDAPCSGEGMMRREPVARSQWSERLVSQCSALQREILSDAVKALKPGGFLIYSTCTFNRGENEENVEWLSRAFGLESTSKPQRFMPHLMRCEGLFVAVFRKPLGDISATPSRVVSLNSLSVELNKAGARILSCGTELSVSKGGLDIPSSRQVLSYGYDKGKFPYVDLSRDDAVTYLRRLPLTLPADVPLGFVAVGFCGLPLGLVKNIGTRANNLYPAEWRIIN